MSARQGPPVIASLVLVVAVATALLVWRPWAADEPPAAPPPLPAEPEWYPAQRQQAFNLQQQSQWCEAKAAWRQIKDQLAGKPEFAHLLPEVEGNLSAVAALCEPPKPKVSEITLPEEPKQRRHPAPLAAKPADVLKLYPVGKTTRSVAQLRIQGQGVNKQWVFKGEAHFLYLYEVVTETKVVENAETAVVFEQTFKQVDQLRADSNQTLEFRWPDEPLLQVVWERLEEDVLRNIPAYNLVRSAGRIVDVVDPRCKRLLTSFHNDLRRAGVKLDDSDEIELVTKIEKLSGLRLRVKYVSGLGVTKIEVLDGMKFDPDELERLAYNSGLFMDFFIAQAAEKKEGETFDVRAEDVGGLLSFGYDVEPSGNLTLSMEGEHTCAASRWPRLKSAADRSRCGATCRASIAPPTSFRSLALCVIRLPKASFARPTFLGKATRGG